jgi:hypothetical protein
MRPETEEHDDLLDAIDKLTAPIRTKIMQDGLDHPRMVTVTRPPLLQQLEEAVAGSLVGIGGSGSLPNERNVLDSDALLRFLTIKSLIGDRARAVKSPVYPQDPAHTLRAWYVAFMSTPRGTATVRFYEGKTKSWVTQIEEKLDPPRIRELPNRCPSCDGWEWWNPIDKHKYLHPLIIEYRQSGANMVEEAVGRCRSCDARWGVRQLAYEIEQLFIRDWDSAIVQDAARRTGVLVDTGTTVV